MLLWILLVIGWAIVLFLAISLFRLAAYADRKMRGVSSHPGRSPFRHEDRVA
jgi:hypothetical protein